LNVFFFVILNKKIIYLNNFDESNLNKKKMKKLFGVLAIIVA
jgi:hypothetical protein